MASYSISPSVDAYTSRIESDNGKGARVELLAKMRKRFDFASTQEAKNRVDALDDLKFKAGEQWPASVKAERESEQRPCLTVNKMKTFVHQITNDMRQNRPAINVSPVGDKSDVRTAQMLRGLIRYIERHSDADLAYDTGFDSAVSNGFGYWRIITEYESEDSFDQCIRVVRVPNPFTVYLDPLATDPCGNDAQWGFVTEMIPRDEFKQLYPKADPMNWNEAGAGDDYRQWIGETHVRIVEYHVAEKKMRRLIKLRNGHTGYFDDLDDIKKQQIKADPSYIVQDREVECVKWKCYKCSAMDVLEDYDWSGSTIPLIRIIGDEVNIEGKTLYAGLIRDAKDPQRMYNYWVTSETEIVALQPKAPYVMEEGQVEGHETRWKFANKRVYPYLLYKGTNVGGKQAPPPRREPPPQASPGMTDAKMSAAQDMIATTGVRFDATKAERTADESGVALRALRQNTELGSYHYIDNHARALRRTGNMFIELIPFIYDTKRIVTILQEDGTEQAVQIDPTQAMPHQDVQGDQGQTLPSFNPNVGKYEVAVTIGPSYATKRIESANELFKFGQAFPQAAPYIGDLVAKNSDWAGAEEMAKRLAMTLPPQMLKPEAKDVSPEVNAYINALQTQLQQLGQQAQQLQGALTEKQTEHKIDVLKIEKDFDAKMAATAVNLEKVIGGRIEANFAQLLEAIKLSQPPPAGSPGAGARP